jgi:hypothetical protein
MGVSAGMGCLATFGSDFTLLLNFHRSEASIASSFLNGDGRLGIALFLHLFLILRHRITPHHWFPPPFQDPLPKADRLALTSIR